MPGAKSRLFPVMVLVVRNALFLLKREWKVETCEAYVAHQSVAEIPLVVLLCPHLTRSLHLNKSFLMARTSKITLRENEILLPEFFPSNSNLN